MNDFDWGKTIGRFFISFIINDYFFGLAVRIGRETEVEGVNAIYYITVQVGYGQLMIGFTS